MALTLTFLDPYQASKILSGVIPANKVKRPNWLQSYFSNVSSTEKDTVNFDVEFTAKNTMGMFVLPESDVTPITLNEFGTKELRFSYAKEGLNSPDYEEINVRQLGQQFGTLDVMGNEAANLRSKLALSEQRFENLFELTATNILLYGGYQAASEKHPTIRYDFGRTVIKTSANLDAMDLVPSVNLTTTAVTAPWDSTQSIMPVLTGTYSDGRKSWSNSNITAKTATPIKDLVKMYETAKFRAGTSVCLMSSDAYEGFNFDLITNYKDSSVTTLDVILRSQQDILPRVKDVQGLTYKRSFPLGNGELIDIYVYDAFYHTRTSGVATKYVPNGFVVLIPPADNGVKVYGRIKHPRANYAAMPRWINYWEEPKTGKREWEIHTNFLMGHTDIDSVVSWKVL
jgi:predicted RNA-binding protein with TRAM domain